MKRRTFSFAIGSFVLATAIAISATAQTSSASQLRFEISFPAASSAKPLDGRMLLLISNNNTREPRLQINEDLTTQQVFGIDVDGLKPGQTATVDAERVWLSGQISFAIEAGRVLGAGAASSLRNFQTLRWSHGEAADGSRRRPAVEPRAGKSLQHAAKDHDRSGKDRRRSRSRSTKSFRRSSRRKTRSTSSTSRFRASCSPKFWGRPMHLGANVLVAGRIRHTSERALSAGDFSRPLPCGLRRLSRDAARSKSQTRLQRALQTRRLQPHRSGARASSFTRNGLGQTFRA